MCVWKRNGWGEKRHILIEKRRVQWGGEIQLVHERTGCGKGMEKIFQPDLEEERKEWERNGEQFSHRLKEKDSSRRFNGASSVCVEEREERGG